MNVAKQLTPQIYNIQEWLLLEEFYFLVEKTRMLLLSATSFEELYEAEDSLKDTTNYLVSLLMKHFIKPYKTPQYLIPTSYRKVQSDKGYNSNVYSQLCTVYSKLANHFNYLVEGGYQ